MTERLIDLLTPETNKKLNRFLSVISVTGEYVFSLDKTQSFPLGHFRNRRIRVFIG